MSRRRPAVRGGRLRDRRHHPGRSAIADIATRRTIYAGVVLRQAVERGYNVVVPAVAWMEAWADAEPAAMPFLELLRSSPAVSFADTSTSPRHRRPGCC